MGNHSFSSKALRCLEKLDQLSPLANDYKSKLILFFISALVYALLAISYELAALRSER